MKWVFLFFIMISSAFIGTTYLFGINLQNVLMPEDIQNTLTVYFKPQTGQEDIQAVMGLVKSVDPSALIRPISQDSLIESFKKNFGMYAEGVFDESEIRDLVPESLEVGATSLEFKEKILQKLTESEALEEVVHSTNWVKRLEKINKSMRFYFQTLLGVVIFAFSLLTILFVRVFLTSSQKQIEVYALIGAHPYFILRKYFISIFLIIVSGLFLSAVILYGVFYLIKNKLLMNYDLNYLTDRIHFLSFSDLALGAIIFMVAGIAGFLIAALQFKNLFYLKSDEL